MPTTPITLTPNNQPNSPTYLFFPINPEIVVYRLYLLHQLLALFLSSLFFILCDVHMLDLVLFSLQPTSYFYRSFIFRSLIYCNCQLNSSSFMQSQLLHCLRYCNTFMPLLSMLYSCTAVLRIVGVNPVSCQLNVMFFKSTKR